MMANRNRGSKGTRESGAALVVVMVAMAGLAMLSMTMLALSSSATEQQRGSKDEISARYVAEAGIADALHAMKAGGDGNRGTQGQPLTFGDSEYWVVSNDLGNDFTALTATGIDGQSGSRIELVVRQTSQNLFRWGAFGDEWMEMDSQAKVDSYDSELGSYASQAVNGSGSDTYANANGSTGSNGDISLEQNAKVFGDATPGVSGTASVTGNAVVTGSTAPMPGPVEFPPIVVPAIASMGNLNVPKNTTTFLASGEYRYESFTSGTGATLNVRGPATIVLGRWNLNSNSNVVVDATDGPVTFYVEGDFIINSNVTVASTTYTPEDIRFNLLSDNIINPEEEIDLDELDFDSNSVLYGTIYAPDASIEIDSNFALYGAIVARRLHLDSNCRIHYDEALRSLGSDGESAFEAVYWRELAYSVR